MICLLAMVATFALPVGGASGQLTARDLTGTGAWQTDGKSAKATQRWSLDVKRGPDNSLTGRVNLAGSPLANAGNVTGHIVGDRVVGSISDDAGNLVAKFEGTAAADGFAGTYTDRTGETGAWRWDGAAAAE